MMFGNLREREENSEKILFWSDEHRPQDYVGCVEDVHIGVLDAVLSRLKEAEVHQSYKGWSECRICGEHLGSRDLHHEGFIFPAQAEHYIEEHGVWTPGLQRFAESLGQADYIGEETAEETMKHCGVFIPLPYDLAKDFPDKSAHDKSVPHFTVLYVGECTPEAYKTLCKIVCQVARKLKPFTLDLARYSEFMNKEGMKIAHMAPSLGCSMKLAVLHGILRRAIEQFGKEIEVSHSYGKSERKGAPYEAQFKPHATLAYLPAMVPYRGPKPTGTWRVNEIECWGFDQRRIPLGKTTAQQPLGLTRDPLTINYPMAVPDVPGSGHEQKPRSVSGDRIKVEGYQDKLPGGLADNSKPEDFDPKQLAAGIKVELEHTRDPEMAREIAMDHLKEDPNYYTKLKKIEPRHESVSSSAIAAPNVKGWGEAFLREPLHLRLRTGDPFLEGETSLKGYETHHGVGGSHGDIGLDGSLPYLEQQKKIDKMLRRKKLSGR